MKTHTTEHPNERNKKKNKNYVKCCIHPAVESPKSIFHLKLKFLKYTIGN